MNPLPTQYELATLAAAIPIPDCWRDDEENAEELVYRANRAIDLWQICGKVIADAPASDANRAEKAEARRLFYSQFPDAETVLLNDFLKVALPTKSQAERESKWREFRGCGFSGEIDTSKLERDREHVDSRVKSDLSDGLPLAGLRLVYECFAKFTREAYAIVASDKAAAAATARHLPKQREADAKSEASRLRKGRGYVAPEADLSPEAIAGKVVAGLAKIQERKLSAKKRVANSNLTD